MAADVAQRFEHARTERRAAEVGVDENAGAVDNRLNALRAECRERGANASDYSVEGDLGFRGVLAQFRQIAPDDGDDDGARQTGVAELLEDLLNLRNGS